MNSAALTLESASLPDQLHEATKYIKKLQMDLERMKEKKHSLMGVERWKNTTRSSSHGPKSHEIQVHGMGYSLVVGLRIHSHTNSSRFVFNQTIRIIHEEGGDIVNASFSVVGDSVFHTIHLTAGHESAPDYGAAARRISERLTTFADDAGAWELAV
ncbi:hypothetical protein V6N13_143740 [Hibiscus sabdariffa]